MKRFYINAILFSFCFLSVLIGFDCLSMFGCGRTIIARLTDSSSFITGNVGSDNIKPYIWKTQMKDDTTKLIVGDSVCRQMFNNLQEYNSDFSINGSNGAITMAGQYILVKEYLDNHPNATDVFLIVLPDSLCRTFDTEYGYQYAVMPFVETNTLQNLDADTIEMIRSIYGGFFLKPQIVTAINLSGVNRKLYLNSLRDHTEGQVLRTPFELADQYVGKINELCRTRGVHFHLYPCPVSESCKEQVHDLEDAFELSDIYAVNPDFLKNVYYYPTEQSSDNIHFSGKYADQEHFNQKIESMFEGEELLKMLILDES